MPLKELNKEETKELLDSLSDYLTLEQHTEVFAKVHVIQEIFLDQAGTSTLPIGTYLMDADQVIYSMDSPIPNSDSNPLEGMQSYVITPLTTSYSEPLKLSNLIFYIGEYMTIPEQANAILGNYFTNSNFREISIPAEAIAPKDKVTQLFFKGQLVPEKETPVRGSKKGSKKLLTSTATVSLLDLPPKVEISREPTDFDDAVFQAICSLYADKTYRFTGGTIWKVMKGDKNASFPTAETLQAIDESWTRLTSIAMRLDTGNMGDAYGFVRWERERRIIEGGKDTVTMKNQHGEFSATMYTIHEKPTLLYYAELLDQIDRYPLWVLDTPVNKTPETLAIQKHLISHIESIPRMNNHILYEKLYEKIDIESPTAGALRKKKADTRKHVKKMLDYWVDKGFIRGWKNIKKGNTIVSIEIDKGRSKQLKEPSKTSNDTLENQ